MAGFRKVLWFAGWLIAFVVIRRVVCVPDRSETAAPPAPARVAPLVVTAAVVDAGVPVDASAPVDAPSDAGQSLHDRVWNAPMMLSPDGKQIFEPTADPDSARGAPNLVYEIRNRAGKRIRRVVVRTVDDDDSADAPAGAADKVRRQELAAANMLDELQAAGFANTFVAIAAQGWQGDDVPGHAELVRDGETTPSITIDLTPTGVLTVTLPGHRPIVRSNEAWRSVPTAARQRAMQKAWDAGETGCFNPAYLGGAAVDLAHRLVVVGIAYHGNDTCWEGPASEAFITW